MSTMPVGTATSGTPRRDIYPGPSGPAWADVEITLMEMTITEKRTRRKNHEWVARRQDERSIPQPPRVPSE